MRWNEAGGKGHRARGTNKIFFCSLCIMLFALCASPARGDSCSVSTTPVNFGRYDAIDGFASNTVGVITINCSAGTSYAITSDAGQNSKGNFQRAMVSSGSTLGYNLFIDPACTEIWGDGTGITFTLTGTGTGAPIPYNIYGRIPGGQKVRAGIYSDQVNVTVDW